MQSKARRHSANGLSLLGDSYRLAVAEAATAFLIELFEVAGLRSQWATLMRRPWNSGSTVRI
jgi:hypothetical protein